MKKLNTTTFVFALCSLLFVLTSCGSSKKASKGYNATQKEPTTVEQKQAANRGVKLQKEECEEMALEETKNLRASGNGISPKEQFAHNIALTDARQQLARQIEVYINNLIRNFNQQHESSATKDIQQVGKASQITNEYCEQFVQNTRLICKNTYVKEDGNYNVYVCIEMNPEQQKAMHAKLTKDQKLSIDFEESQFLKELEKAKEDYRKQQLDE